MSSCDLLTGGRASVDNALHGLVLKYPHLVLLENSRIILRRDHHKITTNVKILSGGGSGHEPSQTGFVGDGMLTAAVAGDIYASPPTSEILRAIRELGCDHPPGVLLIINNYTGDRLNFGLAMERARSENINVDMFVVDDDCSIVDYSKTTGRRGLAGSILIHKLSGALAQSGKTLPEILTQLNLYKSNLRTIGMSLDIEANMIELGKGMHGEPGVSKIALTSTTNIINIMLDKLFTQFENTNDLEVILLINNMGGCSKISELAFTKEVATQLLEKHIKVQRIFSDVYVSSLNMMGYSITVLKCDADILELIDVQTEAPSWTRSLWPGNYDGTLKPVVEGKLVNKEDSNYGHVLFGPKLSNNGKKILKEAISVACDAVEACERQLNDIDAEAGDGDTGSTLGQGVRAIRRWMDSTSGEDCMQSPGTVLKEISKITESSMGGTSGALYSILFEAASNAFRELPNDEQTIDARIWLTALNNGCTAIMKHALAEKGDRSMLDALIGAQIALQDAVQMGDFGISALDSAASAAEIAAQDTVSMKPRAGRASYAHSAQLVMPDAGAHAVGIWLRGANEGAKRCQY